MRLWKKVLSPPMVLIIMERELIFLPLIQQSRLVCQEALMSLPDGLMKIILRVTHKKQRLN